MTPLPDAARAVELVEAGYSRNKASKMTGLARQTIDDIINGNVGWDERANEPLFRQYRQQENKRLTHACTELAKAAIVHAHSALPKASFLQAVLGSAALIDKARLLAGESTENVAVAHRHEVEDLGVLADALAKSLVTHNK
jgi:hypothetical protein